jgi:hypothetical protein
MDGAVASDPVERLWALSEQHAPARVVVLVGHAVTARWLASLLAERGATVGVRIHDTETLLTAAATELAGEPLPMGEVLAEVHAALVEDPTRRFAAIAEHASYQREVLRTFVELERGLTGGTPVDNVGDRDAALLEAFTRFRERMQKHRAWWRGQALQLVSEGHRRVSFLRRRAAAVALGFAPAITSQWELRLLEVLGFEHWDVGDHLRASERPRRPLDLRLSCAGPEAEIAAVARLLRAESERPAAVLAPSDAVPRWVARLRHRDVPVRAWVEQRAANTGAARVARALLRVLVEPTAVRREDLELCLFGPALRAWSATAEQLQIDYPRSPHPGDVHRAWEGQRASSFALAGLAKRLLAAGQTSVEMLGERARRYGWAQELLEQRRTRVLDAHRLLAGAIERLDEVARAGDPAQLRALFDDWDLLGRAAVHSVVGPELTAARVIVDVCARASERERPTSSSSSLTPAQSPGPSQRGFASLPIDLDHALAGASTGSWEQSRPLGGGGGPPVWVLPYASVVALGRLPERLFLTGLDTHPLPPVHHDLISDSLRTRLGLAIDRERFALELRLLDELVGSAVRTVVGSWRHRDGAGAQRPPGPWIAGRQDEGRERAVGVDVIAIPTNNEPPSAPLERELLDWSREPELQRRVEAIRSHEAPDVGPHTGALGVRVQASVPYSASSLQRYAALPYRYFVERVIGLRERERSDSSASLLASEQGQAVHRALEAAHLARLAASTGPIELASQSDALLAQALEALADGYRKRAEHGQAVAIWTNECERWAVELRAWWQQWTQRMRDGYGPSDPGRSGSRARPEPELTIPGLFLLAVEWSPAGVGPVAESPASLGGPRALGGGEAESQAFELSLPLRSIPFVAAVDRIEFDPIRSRVELVDYKTSRPRWPAELAAQLRAGVHLQLPLYAIAVHQVVSTTPERLRLPAPFPVAALRLEYLRRPLARAGKPSKPEVRGFSPMQPLGLDASGRVWTIVDAAASFTTAFVDAIEAGHFPMVAREPNRRGGPGPGDRIDELARVIPSADRRRTGLPPALQPLPDPKAAREVVQ